VVGWAVYALGYLHGEKTVKPPDEKGSQLQSLFSPSLPPFRRLPSDRRRGDTFGKEKDSLRKSDAIPLEMLGTCQQH